MVTAQAAWRRVQWPNFPNFPPKRPGPWDHRKFLWWAWTSAGRGPSWPPHPPYGVENPLMPGSEDAKGWVIIIILFSLFFSINYYLFYLFNYLINLLKCKLLCFSLPGENVQLFTFRHAARPVSSMDIAGEIETMEEKLDTFCQRGSGWVLEKVVQLFWCRTAFNSIPQRVGHHRGFKLPQALSAKKAVVNVVNAPDDQCFK